MSALPSPCPSSSPPPAWSAWRPNAAPYGLGPGPRPRRWPAPSPTATRSPGSPRTPPPPVPASRPSAAAAALPSGLIPGVPRESGQPVHPHQAAAVRAGYYVHPGAISAASRSNSGNGTWVIIRAKIPPQSAAENLLSACGTGARQHGPTRRKTRKRPAHQARNSRGHRRRPAARAGKDWTDDGARQARGLKHRAQHETRPSAPTSSGMAPPPTGGSSAPCAAASSRTAPPAPSGPTPPRPR
jgi:hypothetical protein